jgi:hypothetical protein
MHDEAAHIEVSRAAGVEAVEAWLLKPCYKSLAFYSILVFLFASLLSRLRPRS